MPFHILLEVNHSLYVTASDKEYKEILALAATFFMLSSLLQLLTQAHL